MSDSPHTSEQTAPASAGAGDAFEIPDFLRMTPEQRAAGRAKTVVPHHTPGTGKSMTEAERERRAIELERQALQRVKDAPRFAAMREREAAERKLERETKAAVDAANNQRKAEFMPKAKAKKKPPAKAVKAKPAVVSEGVDGFGLRTGTNYARMMAFLMANKGTQNAVDDVARAAYKGTGTPIEKARVRVITMSRKVQEGAITKGKLPFIIKREKDDNGKATIGIHSK